MRPLFLKTFVILSYILSAFSVYGIDVEPSRIELTLPAGSEQKLNLKLANRTADISIVSVKTGEYRFLLSAGSITPANKSIKESLNSCESWLSTQLTNLLINPASEKDCNIVIKVPKNAKGEYAACIIFDQASPVEKTKIESDNENDNETIGDNEGAMSFDMNLIYRRSIPIYIFVEGTTEIKGEITKVDFEEIPIKESNLSPTKTIKINVTFNNTGSRHVRIKGNAVIMDSQGNIIKTVPTGKTLPVFPGFGEVIPLFFSGYPQKSAQYTAVITLDLGDNVIVQKEANFSITQKGSLAQ